MKTKMSITELKDAKSIIEERLKRKRIWVDAELGLDAEEYYRRESIYLNHEDHEKLKRVNQEISDIIDSI